MPAPARARTSLRPRHTTTTSTPRKYICPNCLHQQRNQSTSTTRPLAYGLYNTTNPPTLPQLKYANTSFGSRPARFLKSTPSFRDLPLSPFPEVAFLGRSNVGKSSLLNALLAADSGFRLHYTGHGSEKWNAKGIKRKVELARTSSKRGRTKMLTAYGVGGVQVVRPPRPMPGAQEQGGQRQGREEDERQFERWVRDEQGAPAFVVLDMPGYGAGSRMEWGREIVKYLTGRRQLRRTFVLVDAEHGVKPADDAILKLLRENAIPHQLVASKIDKLLFPRSSQSAVPDIPKSRLEDLHRRLENVAAKGQAGGERRMCALGDVLGCTAKVIWPWNSNKRPGIEGLRWAVLQAVGLDCDEDGKTSKPEYELQEESLEALDHDDERLRAMAATG